MDDLQQVLDEHAALNEKYNKLLAFIDSPEYQKLGPITRGVLLSQREWMFRYSDALEQRINLFKNPEPLPVEPPPTEDAPAQEHES